MSISRPSETISRPSETVSRRINTVSQSVHYSSVRSPLGGDNDNKRGFFGKIKAVFNSREASETIKESARLTVIIGTLLIVGGAIAAGCAVAAAAVAVGGVVATAGVLILACGGVLYGAGCVVAAIKKKNKQRSTDITQTEKKPKKTKNKENVEKKQKVNLGSPKLSPEMAKNKFNALIELMEKNEDNLKEEGIFRLAANTSLSNTIKTEDLIEDYGQLFDKHGSLIVHILALRIKTVFADCFTNEEKESLLKRAKKINDESEINFPPSIPKTYLELISFLKTVEKEKEWNKMDAHNLGVCFAPRLEFIDESKPNDLNDLNELNKLMINMIEGDINAFNVESSGKSTRLSF